LWGEIVMTVEGLVIWLVIGAIAGWLAGLIMKGYGFGLVGNIVVGIVGAVIAAGSCRGLGLFSSAASARKLSTLSLGQ
jgi:uncharacterized membrane protein YeaQ/YmgE (transglycosylase-associated protein family)